MVLTQHDHATSLEALTVQYLEPGDTLTMASVNRTVGLSNLTQGWSLADGEPDYFVVSDDKVDVTELDFIGTDFIDLCHPSRMAMELGAPHFAIGALGMYRYVLMVQSVCYSCLTMMIALGVAMVHSFSATLHYYFVGQCLLLTSSLCGGIWSFSHAYGEFSSVATGWSICRALLFGMVTIFPDAEQQLPDVMMLLRFGAISARAL